VRTIAPIAAGLLVAAALVASAAAEGAGDPTGTLVFLRDRGTTGASPDVMLIDVGSGSERVLVSGARFDVKPWSVGGDGPWWSPDGQRVALIMADMTRNNRYGVFVLDLATGRLRRVLANATSASWLAGGRQIAALGSLRGRRGVIVADADGKKRPRLVGRTRSVLTAAWSPDGRALAYVSTIRPPDEDMEGGVTGLFVVDLSGKKRPRLVASAESITGPQWSPDSSRIAYVRINGKYTCCEIHAVRRDGRGNGWVVGSRGSVLQAVGPSWSPDGREIAYHLCGQGSCSIHMVRADGTLAADGTRDRILTSPPMPGSDSFPIWSPDGSWIAVTRGFGEGKGKGTAIVVLRADGVDERTVATSGWGPVWSPDGRTIAYVGVDAPATHLYVVGADGTGRRQLTSGPFRDWGHKWRPVQSPAR
jgi:Tol biopolymer transport system component